MRGETERRMESRETMEMMNTGDCADRQREKQGEASEQNERDACGLAGELGGKAEETPAILVTNEDGEIRSEIPGRAEKMLFAWLLTQEERAMNEWLYDRS